MDMLKRPLAPITEQAWQEIDERAREVITSILTDRRVVDVQGPKSWDYPAVPEGRLEILEKNPGQVSTAQYQVKRLVEARIVFEMDRWELDNIERGAKDPDLEPLEKALQQLARFEEESVYNGYEKGGIEGLRQAAKNTFTLGNTSDSIIAAISKAKFTMLDNFTKPPYNLVVSQEVHQKLHSIYEGYPLFKIVQNMIGGNIYLSQGIDGAVLLPCSNEDLELTIGQDYSIGYENHDTEKVRLFASFSFTFRVLDESRIIWLDSERNGEDSFSGDQKHAQPSAKVAGTDRPAVPSPS